MDWSSAIIASIVGALVGSVVGPLVTGVLQAKREDIVHERQRTEATQDRMRQKQEALLSAAREYMGFVVTFPKVSLLSTPRTPPLVPPPDLRQLMSSMEELNSAFILAHEALMVEAEAPIHEIAMNLFREFMQYEHSLNSSLVTGEARISEDNLVEAFQALLDEIDASVNKRQKQENTKMGTFSKKIAVLLPAHKK